MSDDVGQFLGAMKMLQQGMQDTQTRSAITDATAQMQLANSQIKNQSERYNQIQQISQGLTAQLSGIGADPTRISQAVAGIKGPDISDPNSAVMQGVLTGSQQLQNMGLKAQSELNATKNSQVNRQLDIAEMEALGKIKAQNTVSGFDPTQYTPNQVTNYEKLPKDVRERIIPGVGVAAASEDKKAIQASLDSMQALNTGTKQIDALVAKGASAATSPVGRKRIEAIKAGMIGALNKRLTGGGPMRDEEREMVSQTIGQLENLTDITGAQSQIYQDFKQNLGTMKQGLYQVYGVTPFKGVGIGSGGAPVQNAQNLAAKAWATDPKNANDPRAATILKNLAAAGQ